MWAGYRSARLSTRLLLIVLTCLVPIIALAVWVEYGQWAERRAQLGDLALQQAELLNGDVESIADGARVLLSTVAQIRGVRDLALDCDQRLAGISRDLPMFAFLALIDADGSVACASRSGLYQNDGGTPAWVVDQ